MGSTSRNKDIHARHMLKKKKNEQRLNPHIYPVLGRLLFLLSKNINVPAWLVSRVRDIVPPRGIPQLTDLLHLVVREINLLEVLDNPVRRDRLGDNAVVADLRPGQDDLRRRDCAAGTLRRRVGDFFDFVACDEQRLTDHVVAKGRVRRDVDALLVAVVDECVRAQQRVTFDLVGCGNHVGSLDNGLQLVFWLAQSLGPLNSSYWSLRNTYVVNGKVGHANRTSLGLGKCNHSLPGLSQSDFVVNGHVFFIAGVQGHELAAGFEAHGPVNEIQLSNG